MMWSMRSTEACSPAWATRRRHSEWPSRRPANGQQRREAPVLALGEELVGRRADDHPGREQVAERPRLVAVDVRCRSAGRGRARRARRPRSPPAGGRRGTGRGGGCARPGPTGAPASAVSGWPARKRAKSTTSGRWATKRSMPAWMYGSRSRAASSSCAPPASGQLAPVDQRRLLGDRRPPAGWRRRGTARSSAGGSPARTGWGRTVRRGTRRRAAGWPARRRRGGARRRRRRRGGRTTAAAPTAPTARRRARTARPGRPAPVSGASPPAARRRSRRRRRWRCGGSRSGRSGGRATWPSSTASGATVPSASVSSASLVAPTATRDGPPDDDRLDVAEHARPRRPRARRRSPAASPPTPRGSGPRRPSTTSRRRVARPARAGRSIDVMARVRSAGVRGGRAQDDHRARRDVDRARRPAPRCRCRRRARCRARRPTRTPTCRSATSTAARCRWR